MSLETFEMYLSELRGLPVAELQDVALPGFLAMDAGLSSDALEVARQEWEESTSTAEYRFLCLRTMRYITAAINQSEEPADIEFWHQLYHDDPRLEIQAECILAVYRSQESAALDLLAEAVEQGETRVRALALEAVGALVNVDSSIEIGGETPLDVLRVHLKGDDRWQRLGALMGLSLVDGEVDVVLELALEFMSRERDEVLVATAFGLLQQVMDAASLAQQVSDFLRQHQGASSELLGYLFSLWVTADPVAAQTQLVQSLTSQQPQGTDRGALHFLATRVVMDGLEARQEFGALLEPDDLTLI